MSNKFIITLLLLINFIGFSQVTYYVDADALDDTGNGTSEATAWKTIAKVNSETFNPGDQILFNSGDTFYGKLVVNSSGNATDQITYGKYGGSVRPIINGRNYKECIKANKVEYLTFNDLELTNNSDEDTGIIDVSTNGKKNGAEYKRYGFTAYPGGDGTIKHNIVLNNLKIHNIYPPLPNNNDEFSGDAIQFSTYGAAANNIFDGITIENCELTNTGILGININRWIKESDPPPVANRHHKNVTVRNNYIHHTGGSGAVYFYVDGYLFEDNIFTYTGDYTSDVPRFGDHDDDVLTPDIWYKRQRGRGSGYWCVRTKNGILQYNEFSHAHGPKDSCGAHIDIENDNIIIQYNLSWDNAGGFAEYMGANTNCIYRYNISINDGWRVKFDGTISPTPTSTTHPEMFTAKGESNGQVGAAVWFSNFYGGGNPDVPSVGNEVYNNTFYIGTYNLSHETGSPTRNINSFLEFETGTDDNLIQNNIFYIESGSTLSYFEEPGALVDPGDLNNNIYNNGGPIDGSYPAWDGGCGCFVIKNTAVSHTPGGNEQFNSDPLLVNAGGLTEDDYKILPSSPAIDNGKDISNNGGKDFWFNLLTGVPSGEFDIGAHERMCADDNNYTGSWDSGNPTISDQVTIKSNYTIPNGGSFEACQLIVTQNSTLTIPAGEYIKVNGNITVTPGSKIIIEHEGSLVQVDDNALVTNNGTIEVKKTTPVLPHNMFSILGSPMSQEKRDMVFTNSTVVMNHNTLNFSPHPLVASLDPTAENFADDNGDNWSFFSGSEDIDPGVGYLVGPPSGGGAIDVTHSQGTLNNGVINYTTIYNTGGSPAENQNASPNIISNPYASAIDARLFVNDTDNTEVEAVYFWEHLTLPTNGYPGYRPENWDMGDISMHNGTMGSAAPSGGAIPSHYIASGQGFGIKAKSSGPISFKNSMRVTGPNTGYRNTETIDKLYLQVNNPTYNLQSSTGIGFLELATDGYESKYDTRRLATPVSIYSIVEDKELAIQGRSTFNEDHIIPIGFRTQVEEVQIYTISINSIEGEQITQATVYLQDNLLNITTNLTQENYTFTSNESNQKDRFVIVFTEEVLGTSDFIEASISVYPNPTEDYINIASPLAEITDLTVYDVRGRVLQTLKVNNQTTYQLEMSNLETSMYFIKIQTQNGSITKQIIKQ